MSTIGKSASRMYREYKRNSGTLTWPQWLDRQKEKTFAASGEDDDIVMIDRTLNDSVHAAIKDSLITAGLKTKESGKTIFGIDKTVVIIGSLLLLAGTTYLIYYNIKKKQ